jgi:hypothetical protein
MKIHLKQFAAATLIMLAAATADARPIALPDSAANVSQSGTFSVSADNQITLTGNPVSLTTSLPLNGEVPSGSARYMGGSLQYADGTSTVDGKIARVAFGSQIKNGQVTYLLKGLIYGKLTQGGETVDVNGDFSVTTKPAPEGTVLEQTQVDSSHLLVTMRSNINNPQAQ